MNKEEAIAKLKAITDSSDPETAHQTADDILLEVLETNGFIEVARAYRDIPVTFWYA